MRQDRLLTALQTTGRFELMTMLSPVSSTSDVPAPLTCSVPSRTWAVVSVTLPHSPVVIDIPAGIAMTWETSSPSQVGTFNGVV